jgi:hypothetical protein
MLKPSFPELHKTTCKYSWPAVCRLAMRSLDKVRWLSWRIPPSPSPHSVLQRSCPEYCSEVYCVVLWQATCLSIAANELAPESGGVKFFVIDCRPASHFVRASLPTGWSTVSKLMPCARFECFEGRHTHTHTHTHTHNSQKINHMFRNPWLKGLHSSQKLITDRPLFLFSCNHFILIMCLQVALHFLVYVSACT